MQACSSLVITRPPAPPSVDQVRSASSFFSPSCVVRGSWFRHALQFTVIIVSFARVDTLLKIAEHLQRSIYIKEILVAWNNFDVSRRNALSALLILARQKPCPPEIVKLPWVRCLPQVANLVHNR